MKTRKLFLSLIGLTVTLSQFVLISCSNNEKVVSSHFIQKRKYNKGYFLNERFAVNKNKTEITQESIKKDAIAVGINNDDVLTADNSANNEQEKINIEVRPKMTIVSNRKISAENIQEEGNLNSLKIFLISHQDLGEPKKFNKRIKILKDMVSRKGVDLETILFFIAIFLYLSTGYYLFIFLFIGLTLGGIGTIGIWFWIYILAILTLNVLSLIYMIKSIKSN